MRPPIEHGPTVHRHPSGIQGLCSAAPGSIELGLDRALAAARLRCSGRSLWFADVHPDWWGVTLIWRSLPRTPMRDGRG